jgi:hypothetical protein
MHRKILFFLLILMGCFSTLKTASAAEVGDQKSFWVWDLSEMPPGFMEIGATLKAIGEYSYIYVQNEEWEKSVYPDDVEQILDRFENSTPVGSMNPDQGIYENDVDMFGQPPDALDNDPHITILLLDIPGYEKRGSMYEFDGYFNVFDEYSDEYAMATWNQHSNETEMIYINSTLREPTSDYNMAVIAHEFQHMIHWNYDDDEESWVNESLSEIAMLVNGYFTDMEFVPYYLANPDITLTELEYVDYGQMFLWGAYIFEQLPKSILPQIVAEKENGITGLENVLKNANIALSFNSLFENFILANLLDDSSLGSGEYGYNSLELPQLGYAGTILKYPDQVNATVQPYAADYILLQNLPTSALPLSLSITDAQNSRLVLVKYPRDQNQPVEVEPLTAGSDGYQVELPEAGLYEGVVVVVMGLASNAPLKYRLQAGNPPCGGMVVVDLTHGSRNVAILLGLLPILWFWRRRIA